MKIEDLDLIKRIFEAALMAAERPLQRRDLIALFDDLEVPSDELVDEALATLDADCEARGYELKRVASGYRYQVKQDLSRWVSKLWQERAPRYSRALLETLSLIAYRQPITRGEIEDIRGVAVSTQIIKTLLEREWVKAIGHRDVPGRPAIYATTRQFLDYFNLKSLDQLPTLSEIRDLNTISRELNIDLPLENIEPANDENIESEAPVAEPNDLTVAEAVDDVVVDGSGIADTAAAEQIEIDESGELEQVGSEQVSAEPVELFAAESGEIAAESEQAVESPEQGHNEEVAAFESWIDDELVDADEDFAQQNNVQTSDNDDVEMQASNRDTGDDLKL